MPIKIEMLRCFCTVARAGNLADAARLLGRTQSALSMTLKQLEDHLGSPLFESERKNRMTPLGEQVFSLGQRQLHQFDSTIQAIEHAARSPQGVLRIAAVPSVAALVYPHVVRHMSKMYPGLSFDLRDSDTQQVIDALVQGWSDIGIASANRTLNGVGVTPLFNDRFGLVCSQRHPLTHMKAPMSIESVLAFPFVRNALCDQIETPTFRDRLENISIMVRNTQSLFAMALTGDWVTVLPHSVMKFAPHGLVFREIDDLTESRQVHLFLRETPIFGEVSISAHDYIESQIWLD